MKKYNIFLIFLVFFYSDLFSQGLRGIEGPEGTGQVFAAGDSGKILYSLNQGVTWRKISYGNGSVNFTCISTVSALSAGTLVFMGGNDGKVYKFSTIGGLSPVTSYPTGTNKRINGISFSSNLAGFICCDSGLVYRSTDGGETWALRNSGLPGIKFNGIWYDGGLYGAVVGDGGKAYFTTNRGVNWVAWTTNTTNNLLSVNRTGTAFFMTGENGTILPLYEMDPIPASFIPINTRSNASITGVSGVSPYNTIVGGGGGFIRITTIQNGNFSIFLSNPMLANIVGVFYRDSLRVGYAVSSMTDAIIKTTNAGNNWFLTGGTTMNPTWETKLSGADIANGKGNTLCVNPKNKNTIYVVYGNKMYRSVDRAETWTNFGTVGATSGTVTNAHSFYVSGLDTNILMCAIEGTPTDKVVRSTNYGATWTTVISANFTSTGMPLEHNQNKDSLWYFAPKGGGFWRSTNNGESFTEISGNYPFRSPSDIMVKWESPYELTLADGEAGASVPADIYKSANDGAGWVKVFSTPAGETEIHSMFNSRQSLDVAYFISSNGNRYKSINGGNAWSPIQSTSFNGWASCIAEDDPTVIITGGSGQNSSLTTNGGLNWMEIPMPAGSCGAGMIAPDRGYIIAMQCNALLKFKPNYNVIITEVENILSGVPQAYNLYQNYPNPFNPSTEIKYDLVKSGQVTIKIYDQTGRELQTLVNGFKNAGAYTINLNAASFSSGIYYYSLEINGNILTKKMILLK